VVSIDPSEEEEKDEDGSEIGGEEDDEGMEEEEDDAEGMEEEEDREEVLGLCEHPPRRGGAPICIIWGSGARCGLTLNNVLYPTGLYK